MYDPLTKEELRIIRDTVAQGKTETDKPRKGAKWRAFLWIALMFVLFVVGAYFIVFIGTKGM